MQTSLIGFLCMAGVAGIGTILGFKMSKNNIEVSADGAFAATKGTVLTEELLNAAQKSDALLLLAMSVE